MILLGYDIETTGFDNEKDRVIEIGLSLWSTGYARATDSLGKIVNRDGVHIDDEVFEVTGIDDQMSDQLGISQSRAINYVAEYWDRCDAVLTYNGKKFDGPFTMNWAKRMGVELPEKLMIDSFVDIPGVKGQELVTMCAKYGKFVNPFPHMALADAFSTLKLQQLFELEPCIERAKSPMVLVQSHQKFKDNKDAKKFKFRWNPDYKIWWKAMKEMDVQDLANRAPFKISYVDKSITLEELEKDDSEA